MARSPGKAVAWAGIAAQSGDPHARGLYLKILPVLGSADVDESVAKAGPQPWQARIHLAHPLATTPVAELHDPARARSLYQPLRRTWGLHPLMKDTAAALK